MIDTHSHLNHSDFADDLRETLARADHAGIEAMVIVGYDLPSSRDALGLAQTCGGLYATVGLHPHSAAELDADLLQALRSLAADPAVVALGETGLDFYRNLSPRERQLEAFRALVALAVEQRLPVVVHNREAAAETLQILDQEAPADHPVIMHCFSGDLAFAEECRRRDYYLGLAGPVTYPRNEELREVARIYPGKRLLLETDCPWLAPQAQRGRRNEPAFLGHIAETVAEVRGEPLVRLAQQTTENARRVFGLNGEAA